MKSPPPDPDPFPPVLESSLGMSFTTGGDDSWHGTTLEGYNDDDCAESGYINDDQESWLQTTVDVNDQQETLTFWWKVSSEEDCDFLQFYIDGQLQHQISGEVGWHKKSYDISEQGSHTLKWRYFKDYEVDVNDDSGRLDWVQWSGAPDPTPDPPPDPTKWKTIDYTYDPAGRRIKKTIDDDYSLKYIYDGGNVIAEYDHDNFLLRKYIYGPGVDEPICMIDAVDDDAEYYYHYDGLGSVVALSDSDGDTVQTYEYSVYGQVAASDPNFLANPYMFTGRRFDIETGLYYYRARYYNPYIGRFLQTDPIGYGDGINWYAYCRNNPLAFVDPSGLVVVAFYDPTDPRLGDRFLEAADDHGEHVYPMTNPSDVLGKLAELDDDDIDVTEVYFYDHVEPNWIQTESGPWNFNNVEGLQFGTGLTGEALEEFLFDLQNVTSEDTILHFRQCYTAMGITEEGRRSFLEDLALWSDRTVTGSTGYVTYGQSMNSGEPSEGPDYGLGGELWMAWKAEQGTGLQLLWSPSWPTDERPPQPY